MKDDPQIRNLQYPIITFFIMLLVSTSYAQDTTVEASQDDGTAANPSTDESATSSEQDSSAKATVDETVDGTAAQPTEATGGASVTASAPATEEAGAPMEESKSESSWTDKISFKGDFRYRLEIIDIPDQDDDTKVRYRHRIRGRIGMNADLSNGFGVGFQLATGSDDPVSTNQTIGDAFSTKPLWIDLAFVDWKPEFADGLALVLGKMKNPFRKPQKTELVWDGDLNPEGMALGYEREFGIATPFLQTAGFFVEERKKAKDSWLLGVQGGLTLNFAEGLFYVSAGIGYFDHTNIKGAELYHDAEDSFGNSVEALTDDDGGEYSVYMYDYNMIDGFFELGGKIVKFPWAVFGNVAKNIADDVDDGLGWLVGAKLGKAKKPLTFDLKYTYRVVEPDAVLGVFTDSDFIGGGTDGKGHEWNVGFQVVKAMKIGASFFLNKTPAKTEDGEKYRDYKRFQLDFQFKF